MTSAVHICYSHGHYLGQVRALGYRRWQTVTRPCKTPEGALIGAAKKMTGKKRARVLFIDDNPYYEANVVMEAARV